MILTIFYPASGCTRFDEDYYAQTHIPLLRSLWGGLIDHVEQISFPPEDGGTAPYRMITIVRFPGERAFGEAMAHPRIAELQADVAAFTDCVPDVHVGRVAGTRGS